MVNIAMVKGVEHFVEAWTRVSKLDRHCLIDVETGVEEGDSGSPSSRAAEPDGIAKIQPILAYKHLKISLEMKPT